jgi:hypothetical protein
MATIGTSTKVWEQTCYIVTKLLQVFKVVFVQGLMLGYGIQQQNLILFPLLSL